MSRPKKKNAMLGTTDIAKYLRIGRSRADQLTRERGFPEPLCRINATDKHPGSPIWTMEDVQKWLKFNEHRITRKDPDGLEPLDPHLFANPHLIPDGPEPR